MAIYEESSLWTRFMIISHNYPAELENPQLTTTLNYLKYLIQKKYPKLNNAQKERIGYHLGLIEIQCRELRKINQKACDIRINLCKEMTFNVER